MIRLDKLRMENFRCIGEGIVTFNKDVTVLVADNGIGKTTLLDAVSLVLAEFVDGLTATRQSSGILQTDVRLTRSEDGTQRPCTPTELQATGELSGQSVDWACRRKQHDKATGRSKKDIASVDSAVNAVRTTKPRRDEPDVEVILPDVVLPVVAYYRSNRFSLNTFFGESQRRRVHELNKRLSGYRIYLEPLSESLHFNKWYRRTFTAVKHRPVTGAPRQDSALEQLSAVNEAVERVLEPTGWRSLNWSETDQSVTARHPEHGELPLGLLSSGIRTTIAVVADIAHRCARLNPHLSQDIARLTPGVVLIDEVDLHLHPAWQQLIIELLRAAFPSLQFILSTHSPQVLSTVDSSAIRVIQIDDGKAETAPPHFQTRGVESASVLARVMDVDPIPRVEQAEWLSNYRGLVQSGIHDSEEGRSLWNQLVTHFGNDHPVLDDIAVMRRLQDFKRTNGIPLTPARGIDA